MIFALLAMFLIGIGDAINKKVRQENIPIASYLLIQSPFFLLTILVIAFLSTSMKLATQVFTSSPPFLLLMSLFFCCMVIIYNLFFGNFKISAKFFFCAPINGIFMALGSLFLIIALSRGDVSTVTPVVQLSFLITLILSIAFLKESINIFQVINVIFATIPIICIGI